MKFEEVKKNVLECKRCVLHETKTNYVFGEGDVKTKVMFIGEAPGANEDREGRPFIGRAGGILDELLSSIKMERVDVFICNILKCRPPENRNPKPSEIESCTPFLNQQIENISPKVICCLGNFATDFIMSKYGLKNEIRGISKIHGKKFNVSTLSGGIIILPLYHPAMATYNPEMRKVMMKDIKVLKGELK